MAQECAGHQAVRDSCSVYSLSFYILISIVVVTVHFLCCSVKLSLSRPTSFTFFFCVLLPTPAGEGMLERPRGPWLPAGAKPRHK